MFFGLIDNDAFDHSGSWHQQSIVFPFLTAMVTWLDVYRRILHSLAPSTLIFGDALMNPRTLAHDFDPALTDALVLEAP
jgi:hypothetical protein